MQLELELSPGGGPALLIASSSDEAWQGGIADWVARSAAQTWAIERPALVVVPTRGQAQALKARLFEAGLSALGLQFVTPPYLRQLLYRDSARRLPLTEHLRLLFAAAAEAELSASEQPKTERLAAISVRRTPDHLLHLLEQLSAAGWDFDEVDLPAFRPTVRRFRAYLAECNFEMVAEVDRAAWAHQQKVAPLFSDLLVCGFHGGHWQLWHLLRSALSAAEKATILLQYPRAEATGLDASWIGSWEEALGEAKPAVGEPAEANSLRDYRFLAGLDAQEQAAAVTASAVQFLSDKRCTRLGIVFPAPGALSRLVAAALTRQSIPHFDATGQKLPGIFETPVFAAWLELQRSPRLNVLLRFLASLQPDHALFASIHRAQIDKSLRNALGEMAIDDLAILTAYARDHDRAGEAIGTAVQAIQFLPESSTFAQFLHATAQAFAQLGWDERWREIEGRAGGAAALRCTFSRTLYLRWLGEIASTLRITRDVTGNHPYARVQILTPAQAEDQSWSHLILAGLNEGAWPVATRGDFLPSQQIEEFNRDVQKMNQAATRRGRQGEGHVVVQEGKALFLGSQEQRQLARAQFSSLVESATVAVALTASVIQEGAPERVSNPSEFFSRLYHENRGVAVSQTTLRSLRDMTRRWLDDSQLPPREMVTETPAIAQTRVAYLARRASATSDEYDFALRTPPAELRAMSVSDVESLLKSPALTWMRRYLDVKGAEDTTYAWNSTLGKWTHKWLAQIGGGGEGFVALPNGKEIARAIAAAAEQKRSEALRLCQLAGRSVPDWWESGWDNALCLAQTLGHILATAQEWKWAVPEWRSKAQPIEVSAGCTLLIQGRTDLLLGQTEELPTSLKLPKLWIVDFKTGNKKGLVLSDKGTEEQRQVRAIKLLLKKDALQLALYALAAQQLGAGDVDISLLSPLTPNAEPQLRLKDFAGCEPVFNELARMQQTGIFGMKGSLRGRFSFTDDYPLATLAIDPDLLNERWELTHKDLALEEDIW